MGHPSHLNHTLTHHIRKLLVFSFSSRFASYNKQSIFFRFLVFVGSLSSSEQQFWFPNQNVQDPDTWTFPHLIQLKQEYKKIVEDFNCDIQEFITVQDLPDPPSNILDQQNILHLPDLTSLHSATTRNMELLESAEPWKVQPSSQQRTLSRQLMMVWSLWQTNIVTVSVSNTRILES